MTLQVKTSANRYEAGSKAGLSVFDSPILQTMNWPYIIIGSIGVEIALLTLVYNLAIRGTGQTIKTLEAHNKWLEQQVNEAKENSPDKLAERLTNRNNLLKAELEQLSKELEVNQVSVDVVKQKEAELSQSNIEIETLKAQIERANELLENATYYKEQFSCPTCGAEVTSIAGEDVEYRAYACGSSSGPDGEYPCPHDPDFPKFEDYNMEVRELPSGKFFCNPKPKNKNAYKLTLQPQAGATVEEAIRKIKTNFERLLPKKQSINPSAG